MSIVFTKAVIQDVAESLVDTDGLLDNDNLRVILYKENFTPSNIMTYQTMPAQADFTGYGAASVTFGATFRTNDGAYATTCGVKLFISTGTTVQNTIYGWGLVDGSASVLLGAELLENPESVVGPPDSVAIVPVIKVPLTGLGGSGLNVGG